MSTIWQSEKGKNEKPVNLFLCETILSTEGKGILYYMNEGTFRCKAVKRSNTFGISS